MVKSKPVMLLPPTLPNTPIIAPPINVPHGTLTYSVRSVGFYGKCIKYVIGFNTFLYRRPVRMRLACCHLRCLPEGVAQAQGETV